MPVSLSASHDYSRSQAHLQARRWSAQHQRGTTEEGYDLKQLIEFKTDDGASIIVEVEADEPGIQRVARADDVVPATVVRFEEALQVVRPTADALIGRLQDLARIPQEIEVEFGIRMNVKAGAVIASTEGEGHFRVKLVWREANH